MILGPDLMKRTQARGTWCIASGASQLGSGGVGAITNSENRAKMNGALQQPSCPEATRIVKHRHSSADLVLCDSEQVGLGIG